MLKVKILAGLVLMTVVLVVVTSTAMAAPAAQDLGGTATITPTPDLTGTPEPTVTVTPTPTPTATAENPVGAIIASFFGLDYSVVDQLHQDGTGYGVIAQSCWMSYQLQGDAAACADIAEAKKTGDFSAFVLPDGTTATNWGQFKKALSDHKGPGQTLGAIVSGHAKPIGTQTPDGTPSAEPSTTINQPGNGNGNSNPPGLGNGNGNNGNNSNGNGNDKNKDPNKKNNGKGPKK